MLLKSSNFPKLNLSSNSSPSTVARCLFGPVNHEQTEKWIRLELNNLRELAESKWNFDFQGGYPQEKNENADNRFSWEPVPMQEIPTFYSPKSENEKIKCCSSRSCAPEPSTSTNCDKPPASAGPKHAPRHDHRRGGRCSAKTPSGATKSAKSKRKLSDYFVARKHSAVVSAATVKQKGGDTPSTSGQASTSTDCHEAKKPKIIVPGSSQTDAGLSQAGAGSSQIAAV